MTIFTLHTNEGTRYVRSTHDRLRVAMYQYIRDKRSRGYNLSEIVFCWSPLIISGTI